MATSKQNLKQFDSALQSENLYKSLESVRNELIAKRIDEKKILLELQKGDFSPQEASFIKDENNQEYVVIPEALLKNILQTIKTTYEEKLKVELERDIATHTPIDFDDVMMVALNKLESIRKSDGSLPRIDTYLFVEQIKKEHPNLFFDLDEYFRRQRGLNP